MRQVVLVIFAEKVYNERNKNRRSLCAKKNIEGVNRLIMFVEGILEYRLDNALVINCGGIGYNVQMDMVAGAALVQGEKVRVFTYMSVKDDGCNLFGFLTMEELNMFNMLITVSGVGPKAAQAMLAAMPPTKLIFAIISDDIKELSKAQGVGKKTAARVILELKDKLATGAEARAYESQGSIDEGGGSSMSSGEKQDAIDALAALGYSRSDAMKAVLETTVDGMSAEEIIKAALRKLVK